MTRWSAVPCAVWLVAACGRFGFDGMAPEDLGGPAADRGPTDGATDHGGQVDGAAPDGGAHDGGCDPSACRGWRCGPDGCSWYSSCKLLHAAEGSLGDGVYEIDPDGAGPRGPLSVHCDMTTDGGGWMLVARSVATASRDSFGWNNARGSVDDDSRPYSLGLGAALTFTEALVGTRSGGKAWDARLYRVAVPPAFVSTYTDSAVDLFTTLATLSGDCQASSVHMLSCWGFTSEKELFFLRDKTEFMGTGLRADGFDTFYADCLGGEMNGGQGMIMVR